MKTHLQQKTTGGNFPCNLCDKSFTIKSSLQRHMQLHTGQYKYHCTICRKGFNESTNYKTHMRVHEGIKYNCHYCSKSLSRNVRYRIIYRNILDNIDSRVTSVVKDSIRKLTMINTLNTTSHKNTEDSM